MICAWKIEISKCQKWHDLPGSDTQHSKEDENETETRKNETTIQDKKINAYIICWNCYSSLCFAASMFLAWSAFVCLCIWVTWVVFSHILILFAEFLRQISLNPFMCNLRTFAFFYGLLPLFLFFSTSVLENEQESLSKLRQRFKNLYIFWHESKHFLSLSFSLSSWNPVCFWTIQAHRYVEFGILLHLLVKFS